MLVLCIYSLYIIQHYLIQCVLSIPRLETQYKVIEFLGEGGFGVVYHVRHKLDGTDYAVKIIKLPKK